LREKVSKACLQILLEHTFLLDISRTLLGEESGLSGFYGLLLGERNSSFQLSLWEKGILISVSDRRKRGWRTGG
jgi:hypothetical protein